MKLLKYNKIKIIVDYLLSGMLEEPKGAFKQHKIAVVAAHFARSLIGVKALDEGEAKQMR